MQVGKLPRSLLNEWASACHSRASSDRRRRLRTELRNRRAHIRTGSARSAGIPVLISDQEGSATDTTAGPVLRARL
jgi:hypothetical protein